MKTMIAKTKSIAAEVITDTGTKVGIGGTATTIILQQVSLLMSIVVAGATTTFLAVRTFFIIKNKGK